MRLVKVSAPEGQGIKVIEIAHKAGIKEAVLQKVEVYSSEGEKKVKEVIDLQNSTPKVKSFIDQLMASPFFNPEDYRLLRMGGDPLKKLISMDIKKR